MVADRASYFAYRSGAAIANAIPERIGTPVAEGIGRGLGRFLTGRRTLVARNLQRATGGRLQGKALERAVSDTFASYGRYWLELFRLPRDARVSVEPRFDADGWEHIDNAITAGTGVILALPHLGGFDFAATWLAGRGVAPTVVVEPVEPPELFEWFAGVREAIGMEVIPLGPDAGPRVLRALKANRVLCLLSDRDLAGDGVEVEFFGERTTLPGGPATLALRTGAPLVPAGVYFRPHGGHYAKIGPPLVVEREGRLRDDVGRITQELARRFEELIRMAPEQWHLMQPNWPSDAPGERVRVKVSIVSPYSLSAPGGVQGQVLGLARALRLIGVDARVIGPCDGPPPEPGVTTVGPSVRFVSNGSISPMARAQKLASERTLEALRSFQPDVMHLHEPLVPGPTSAALLGAAGAKVGTFHAAGEDGHPAYRALKKVAVSAANQLTIRTAVSADARQMAEEALGGSYIVLPNGVDLDRFKKADPVPTTRPAVLFLGRHEPRKGLGVLLDAWAGLDREAVLWVASDGPETEALRERRTPNVVWLGRITDDEKAARLKAATIFCAPALGQESFGIVLLEAMAAGTAVLASDIPGYRNVARPDQEALLVPPGDPEALRAGLRRLLDADGLRSDLIDAGDLRVPEFSLARLAERYLPVYETAIAVAT